MQGGRRGRDDFFGLGDPFAGFGGFGGFGGQGSLISSVFGGRDPFDDPFFTRPFGGSPFGSMFESSSFGAGRSPFVDSPAGFLGHRQAMPQSQPQSSRQRGPIIEELDSDDEKVEHQGANERKDNPRKYSRSGNAPHVEHPDASAAERRDGRIQFRNEYNRMNNMSSQPQSQSFTFHSSAVTYGGGNGSYYTKSSTRRSGSDGVTFEEHKEADSNSGRAFHEVSRGLHNRGHTLTRNLNSDGRVDSMQTLHNLNEDELAGFEDAWKGNARKHLPGLNERFNGFDNIGGSSSGLAGQPSRGGWALPSTEHPHPHPHPHPQQNMNRVRTDAVPPPPNPTASQSQYYGRRKPENEPRGRTRA